MKILVIGELGNEGISRIQYLFRGADINIDLNQNRYIEPHDTFHWIEACAAVARSSFVILSSNVDKEVAKSISMIGKSCGTSIFVWSDFNDEE